MTALFQASERISLLEKSKIVKQQDKMKRCGKTIIASNRKFLDRRMEYRHYRKQKGGKAKWEDMEKQNEKKEGLFQGAKCKVGTKRTGGL